MSQTNESTSLLCIFHNEENARKALDELRSSGLAASSITSIAGPGAPAQIASFNMPDRDRRLLEGKLGEGAVLLKVEATQPQVSVVESIFANHSADLVDEFDLNDEEPAAALAAPVSADAGMVVPIVEEELVVGKRTVDQGGVRVFRRVVEIPVSESIQLRDEHVVLDRHAVNRPATEADLSNAPRSLELTETAEEAVISKKAHVVEEVLLSKQSSDRVQHVEDTVRRTEIETEELPAQNVPSASKPKI